MEKKHTSKSLEETVALASEIVSKALSEESSGAVIVSFSGDLGTGKTTCTKSVAKLLGVQDVITSPTFLVLKQYSVEHPDFDTFVHIDAYKVQNETEILPLRLGEIFSNQKAFVVIEWPENLKNARPKETLKVEIKTVGENEREFTF